MLEVGKWYRILGSGFHEYLFQYKKTVEHTSLFGKWLDGVYRGESYHPTDWHGIEPLETLTPSEALILLAKGFELMEVLTDKIIKLDGHSVKFRYLDDTKKPHIAHIWVNSFKGFTIHAIPSEKTNG